MLGSDEYAEEVAADAAQATAYGATGVPFFVVDRRYGVSGAQPSEVFAQVLERAWSESQPLVRVGADGAGPATRAAPTAAPSDVPPPAVSEPRRGFGALRRAVGCRGTASCASPTRSFPIR